MSYNTTSTTLKIRVYSDLFFVILDIIIILSDMAALIHCHVGLNVFISFAMLLCILCSKINLSIYTGWQVSKWPVTETGLTRLLDWPFNIQQVLALEVMVSQCPKIYTAFK